MGLVARGADFDADEPTHIASRQISSINYGDVPDQFVPLIKQMDATRGYSDVGTLQDFSVAFCLFAVSRVAIHKLRVDRHRASVNKASTAVKRAT
jgi:hypothetical protein